MTIRNLIFSAASAGLRFQPFAYLLSQTTLVGGWGGTVPSNNTWPRYLAMQKTTSYNSAVISNMRGIWAVQQEYPNSNTFNGVIGRWYNPSNGAWLFTASQAMTKGDNVIGLVPSTATIGDLSVSNYYDAFVFRDVTDYSNIRVIVQPPAGNYQVLQRPAGTPINWASQAVISGDGQWVYVSNSTSGALASGVVPFKGNNTTTTSINTYNALLQFGQPSGTAFGAYALKTNQAGSVITAWGFSPTALSTEAQHIWKRSGTTFTQYQILATDSTASRPAWGRDGDGTALSGDGQYFAIVSSLGTGTAGSAVFVNIYKDNGSFFQYQALLAFPGVAGVSNFTAFSIDINYDGSVIALYNPQKNAYSVYRRAGTTWSLQGNYTPGLPYTTVNGGVRINNDGTLMAGGVGGAPGTASSAIALWAI